MQHRRSAKGGLRSRYAILLGVAVTTAACPALPTATDPRVEDPCYSSTIWMDTLALAVDSVSWEWTPGRCD